MNQGAVLAWVLGGVLVVALGALALGGLGTRVESSVSDPVPAVFDGPPADGSSGVVMGTYQSKSGISFFGLTIGESRWEASIALVLPEGCEPDGDRLDDAGACAGVPATGRLSGGGTTAAGLEFAIVSTRVSERCHEALETYERWPSSKPECAR